MAEYVRNGRAFTSRLKIRHHGRILASMAEYLHAGPNTRKRGQGGTIVRGRTGVSSRTEEAKDKVNVSRHRPILVKGFSSSWPSTSSVQEGAIVRGRTGVPSHTEEVKDKDNMSDRGISPKFRTLPSRGDSGHGAFLWGLKSSQRGIFDGFLW
ncbi:unnamed protein product [Amaranthus hypochondriacus]